MRQVKTVLLLLGCTSETKCNFKIVNGLRGALKINPGFISTSVTITSIPLCNNLMEAQGIILRYALILDLQRD